MLIYICEDSQSDILRLKHHLDTYSHNNKVLFDIVCFSSALKLLSCWHENHEAPAILFVDIYMEGINGVELTQRLRQDGFSSGIIFTTSSLEYAMASYEVNALYYLQKPYTHHDFVNAMSRCSHLIKQEQKKLTLVIKKKVHHIPYCNILFIESDSHRVLIHTTDEILSVSSSLSSIDSMLDDDSDFISCGRSYIININHVKDCSGDDLIMSDGSIVQIPVRLAKNIHDTIQHKKNGRNNSF